MLFLECVRLTWTKVSDRVEMDTFAYFVLDPESSSVDCTSQIPRRNLIEASCEVFVTREGSVDVIWFRSCHFIHQCGYQSTSIFWTTFRSGS